MNRILASILVGMAVIAVISARAVDITADQQQQPQTPIPGQGHKVGMEERPASGGVTSGGQDPVVNQAREGIQQVNAELTRRTEDFRENCFPMPRGCRCQVSEDQVERYRTDEECRVGATGVPMVTTPSAQ